MAGRPACPIATASSSASVVLPDAVRPSMATRTGRDRPRARISPANFPTVTALSFCMNSNDTPDLRTIGPHARYISRRWAGRPHAVDILTELDVICLARTPVLTSDDDHGTPWRDHNCPIARVFWLRAWPLRWNRPASDGRHPPAKQWAH